MLELMNLRVFVSLIVTVSATSTENFTSLDGGHPEKNMYLKLADVMERVLATKLKQDNTTFTDVDDDYYYQDYLPEPTTAAYAFVVVLFVLLAGLVLFTVSFNVYLKDKTAPDCAQLNGVITDHRRSDF